MQKRKNEEDFLPYKVPSIRANDFCIVRIKSTCREQSLNKIENKAKMMRINLLRFKFENKSNP